MLTLVFGVCAMLGGEPQDLKGDRVVRVRAEAPRDFLAVMQIVDDVWTHSPRPGVLDVRVGEAELAALRALGLEVTTIIPDLDAEARRIFGEIEALNRQEGLTFYDNFRTAAEIRARVDAIQAANPDQVSFLSAGTTLESRDIWGVRISARDRLGNPRDRRPQVFINSTQHAREWLAPMATTYFIERLLARSGEPEIADVFNRVEFIVVPIVNADGYEYTWSLSANRFWRKNMRRDAANRLIGVDLNRNWTFQWGGAGASTNPSNETYRGASALSEPETASVAAYLRGLPRLAALCDVHTHGEMVLSPWGYTNTPPVDAPFFNTWNTNIRDAIAGVNGRVFRAGSLYPVLYPASGVLVDFGYGDQGAWSWTFELRGGSFAPPPADILPGCAETFPGLLMVAMSAAQPVCTADANLDGQVDFNDYLMYINLFEQGDALADLNDDGAVDFNDYLSYLNAYNTPC